MHTPWVCLCLFFIDYYRLKEQLVETGFAADEKGHEDMTTCHSQVEETQMMVDRQNKWLRQRNTTFSKQIS